MLGLQKSFVEPMEAYTKAEYGRLADNKKAWEATEESYVAVSQSRDGDGISAPGQRHCCCSSCTFRASVFGSAFFVLVVGKVFEWEGGRREAGGGRISSTLRIAREGMGV